MKHCNVESKGQTHVRTRKSVHLITYNPESHLHRTISTAELANKPKLASLIVLCLVSIVVIK